MLLGGVGDCRYRAGTTVPKAALAAANCTQACNNRVGQHGLGTKEYQIISGCKVTGSN